MFTSFTVLGKTRVEYPSNSYEFCVGQGIKKKIGLETFTSQSNSAFMVILSVLF